MAHMDTVPICAGARPARRGRRVISSARGTGLGGDDRAGAAAVLVAALEILERRLPHPPLTLVWTVQEEVGLFGARFLDAARLGRPSAAFNFDGASPAEIVIGATGALRMRISIHGFAAHAGAHPDRGVSAIAVAGLGIARLQEGGWHGLVRKGRRRGTSNVGVFQAGEATNVVTDHALLRAEARSHDRRFRRRILAAYREAFAWAAAQVRDARGRRARVRFEASKDYESFRLPETLPCVRLAEGAVRGIGRKPSLRVVDGGLDANWLNARGIPAVTLGIGQREIHTAREWLDLDDYLDGCRLALALAAPPA
jgi:tripeptide aminopeptidase